MIPTTWLSLPCALTRDAMTSFSRVNMVRADWAADEGGGGALVIAILLTEGCGARQYPARDCLFYCPEARKTVRGFRSGWPEPASARPAALRSWWRGRWGSPGAERSRSEVRRMGQEGVGAY